jgi:RND superfamily putative drug exporter
VLDTLARSCYKRRWLTLILWVVAGFGVFIVGQSAGADLNADFRLPESDSQRAFELLEERFPAQSGDTARIVFKAPQTVDDPAVRQPIEQLFGEIARIDHITEVQSPYLPGLPFVSPDRNVAFATVAFDVIGPDLPDEVIDEIRERVDDAQLPAGVQVELGGTVVRFSDQEQGGFQEGVGVLAAIVILLVAFGSVIAMGLPIMTAIFGLLIGIGGIGLFAHLVNIPEFAPQLAGMIGLGVGIDYALFIVTRYRQALHSGMDPEDAIALSITTAGRAVLFAGVTVVISLLGLFLIGLEFIQGLAIGASFTVLVIMIASVTLLPAVLGFAGHAIDRLRVPFLHRDESDHRDSFWFRWSRIVQRRPWPAAVAGSLILVVLAIPFFSIRLGFSDEGNDPETTSARRAYDLLAEGFGAGFNGPLILAAEIDSPDDTTTLATISSSIASIEGVAFVSPPRSSPGGDAAVMTVIPQSAPQDQQTQALVERLHSEIPRLVGADGPTVHVGGFTAAFVDMSDYLERRLPYFIGAVVVLSFLLLMVVFRSLLIPLKAAIVNMLGIGAAYGIVVAIFQWGWMKDVFGVERTGPIEPFLPMMLFAILFGLSMDYEVFLMSRIREEYLRSKRNDIAVADGLAATARVITAAAAIMVTLFLSFVVFGGDRTIKLFGLGLAVAIFLDATLIRMVVVPSLMELFGDANWWLPRWLDRIIPKVSIERVPDAVSEAPATVVVAETASARDGGSRRPASKKKVSRPKPKTSARKTTTKPAASRKSAPRKTTAKKPPRKSSPRT